MPTQHPTQNHIGVRTLTFGGLTATAVALSLALPAPASAEPDLDEEFKKVSAELGEAESELSDLTAEHGKVTESHERAQNTLDKAPKSLDDILSTVDVSGSAVDRLSALNGYGNAQTASLSAAISQRAAAEKRLGELDDAIARYSSEVDDLTAQRAELRDEIAEQEAEESSGASTGQDAPDISSDSSGAVEFAKQQLGDPYVFGATGPDSWDCSSLTQAAWQAAGKDIGRDTYAQWDNVAHISGDNLKAGDLVFYNSQGHVALYVGDGKVIHAPTSGDVVRYGDVDMMPIDGYARP